MKKLTEYEKRGLKLTEMGLDQDKMTLREQIEAIEGKIGGKTLFEVLDMPIPYEIGKKMASIRQFSPENAANIAKIADEGKDEPKKADNEPKKAKVEPKAAPKRRDVTPFASLTTKKAPKRPRKPQKEWQKPSGDTFGGGYLSSLCGITKKGTENPYKLTKGLFTCESFAPTWA